MLYLTASALGSEALAVLGAEVSRRLPAHRIGPYFGWSNTFTQLGSACAALVVPALTLRSTDLRVWACLALYGVGAAVVARLVRSLRAWPVVGQA